MSTENALPPTPSPIATNALAIAFERSSTQRKSRQNPCNVSLSAEGRLLQGRCIGFRPTPLLRIERDVSYGCLMGRVMLRIDLLPHPGYSSQQQYLGVALA